MSKKDNPKYPREITCSITSKDIKIKGLLIDKERLIVIPVDKDGNPVDDFDSSKSEYYRGKDGEKHVTSTWFSTGGEFENDFAFNKFDAVYMCDTATREFDSNGLRTSVSVVLKLRRDEQKEGSPASIIGNHFATICWVWKDSFENLEPYAWGLFSAIHNRREPDKKVCLIVDSEYPFLEEYNRRERLLAAEGFWYEEGLYLPTNFELNYATSNSAQSWETYMMRRCDKISKQILKEFMDSLTVSHVGESNFVMYRYTDVNGVEEKCF